MGHAVRNIFTLVEPYEIAGFIGQKYLIREFFMINH